MELLLFDRFLASQQGSFNHRHHALGFRIKQSKKVGANIPPKRHDKEKITPDFQWVQKQRRVVRKQSLVLWPKTNSAASFDAGIKQEIDKLTNRTRIYHYIRAVKDYVKAVKRRMKS